jgi:hypothetical protein
MLTIKTKFTPAVVHKILQAKLIKFEAAIINRLHFIGEQFVIDARNNSDNIPFKAYKDQTGNLRSSIGYAIIRNGQIIAEVIDPQPNRDPFEGRTYRTGSRKGNPISRKVRKDYANKARQIARRVASEYPKGYLLVGFAGMEYAAAVEAKGYDVITNATITAGHSTRKIMGELITKLNRHGA